MSGADITMIQDWARVSKQGGNVKEILDDFFSPTMLEELPQPVIAAVNGYALGMGCEIALGCDLRIASENTRFGQPEITLGIMTGGGGSVRLTRLIGKTKAMEMVLTGGLIDAQEAYRLGLVNRVVQIAELDAAIDEMTRKLISKGAIALRSSKASVNRALEVGLKDAIANELNLFSEIFKTEDAREGATAFLEKRKPHFQGK
jgi:enoyl-CoA hydratase